MFNWQRIKDIQVTYYKASVLDLYAPSDYFKTGSLFKIAAELNIKYIFKGYNYQSKFVLPLSSRYINTDLINIKNIHTKFGRIPLKGVSNNGLFDQIHYGIRGFKSIPILYYIDYNLEEAKILLENEIGLKDFE